MWKESFHLIPHGKGSSYNKIIQKTFRNFLFKKGRKQLFSKKILQRKGRRNNETLNFCFIHFIFLIATIPFIFVLYIYILYVLINGFQLHLNQINSYRAKYFCFYVVYSLAFQKDRSCMLRFKKKKYAKFTILCDQHSNSSLYAQLFINILIFSPSKIEVLDPAKPFGTNIWVRSRTVAT